MEKIEYGEFLRLRLGKIVKYGEKKDTRVENNRYIDYSGEYEWETCIVKHSFNIIDLIEVGDYVNGYRITDIGNDCVEIEDGGTQIKKNEIKSIVTKEQFESVEYKLDN